MTQYKYDPDGQDEMDLPTFLVTWVFGIAGTTAGIYGIARIAQGDVWAGLALITVAVLALYKGATI